MNHAPEQVPANRPPYPRRNCPGLASRLPMLEGGQATSRLEGSTLPRDD